MQTFHIELTMEEMETIERALMTYKDRLSLYALQETNEKNNIHAICTKLNKA